MRGQLQPKGGGILKTRTLIILALIAGVAILVAFTVQVLMAAS